MATNYEKWCDPSTDLYRDISPEGFFDIADAFQRLVEMETEILKGLGNDYELAAILRRRIKQDKQAVQDHRRGATMAKRGGPTRAELTAAILR